MYYFSLSVKEVPAICVLPGPACLKSLSVGFSVGVASGRHKQLLEGRETKDARVPSHLSLPPSTSFQQ